MRKIFLLAILPTSLVLGCRDGSSAPAHCRKAMFYPDSTFEIKTNIHGMMYLGRGNRKRAAQDTIILVVSDEFNDDSVKDFVSSAFENEMVNYIYGVRKYMHQANAPLDTNFIHEGRRRDLVREYNGIQAKIDGAKAKGDSLIAQKELLIDSLRKLSSIDEACATARTPEDRKKCLDLLQ